MFAVTTGVTGFFYLAFYHLYMKKRSALTKPSVEPTKDVEKPPPNFENIDLSKHGHGINGKTEDKPIPLPYEDAVTNLAYEDTEGSENGQEEPSNVIDSKKAASHNEVKKRLDNVVK